MARLSKVKALWTMLLLLACLVALGPASADAYDPGTEAGNYARVEQRFHYDQMGLGYQQVEAETSIDNFADVLLRDATSGGDRFSGSLCSSGFNGCNGDVRVYDWDGNKGYEAPILYRNRNGAHIEGHVWVSYRALRELDAAKAKRAQLERQAHGAHSKSKRKRLRTQAAAIPTALPGIVIETGSVQAPERWYLWAA